MVFGAVVILISMVLDLFTVAVDAFSENAYASSGWGGYFMIGVILGIFWY